MKHTIRLLLVGAVILISGCAGMRAANFRTDPPVVEVDKDLYTVQLASRCTNRYGCTSFELTIISKTEKNIEVDWNRTLFVSRGQTSGGFMYEGVVIRDRNNPKPPDIIFGNSTFKKIIWPNNLVSFDTVLGGGWQNATMPVGDNGVFLSLHIDGAEINERLSTTVIVEAPPQKARK